MKRTDDHCVPGGRTRRESCFREAVTLGSLFGLFSEVSLRQLSRDIMLIIEYIGKKLKRFLWPEVLNSQSSGFEAMGIKDVI